MALSSVLWTHVLSFLDAEALVNVLRTSRGLRIVVKRQVLRWKEIQIGMALARWIRTNVVMEIHVQVQEMQNQMIRRSMDMRVPPRVQSVWIERGTIEAEKSIHQAVGSFYVSSLQRLIPIEFDCHERTPKPMLLHTTSLSRTLYTALTLVVCGKEVRRHLYHKQIGDLHAISVAEKHAWAQAGGIDRYDVANSDKTCQLKLGLPAHIDGMVDCFHIDHATFILHKHELFPIEFYSLDVAPTPTSIQLEFYNLSQETCLLRKTIPCEFHLQVPEPSSNEATPEARTGIEHFEIARFKSMCQFSWHNASQLSTAGRIVMTIRHSGKSFYHAVMFHTGTRRKPNNTYAIEASWVPGVLEYSMYPDSLDRRPLKGTFSCELSTDGTLIALEVLAQHLSSARLQRYAARISSYSRKAL